MRLKIPMTGTVTGFDPEGYKLDGIGVSGDNTDPVRLIGIDLGNVSWRLVGIDLENDLMEVEVSPPEKIYEPVLDSVTGKLVVDANGLAKVTERAARLTEQQEILANAQHIIEGKTSDEIYLMTGDKRLVKPASVMEKYRAAKATV